MGRIFTLWLVFLAGTGTVFSQQTAPTGSQLPSGEPFKISRGSSFSAGVSRNNEDTSAPGRQTRGFTITKDFSEALKIIRDNHVSGKILDYNAVTKSSITTMLRTLDPHSNYFDQSEFQELLSEQQSEYFGIGATIVNYQKDNKFETYISSTFPNSPASNANLNFGDKISSVDGENVSGKSSAFVRDKVRGRKGTVVRLGIVRAATEKLEIVEITRNRVPQPSIPDAYILRPGIGYIDLTNGFNYTTLEEFDVALRDLEEQGMKSLVLDLRENPGGILEQAVRITEKFLEKGQTVVSQRGRFRIDNLTWKSRSRAVEKMPLVILVNGNSASASEIVAGALQDYDRALIVGENTFGKGLVQSVITLPYNAGLTLTTARYYTPSGRSIQRDYSSGNLYDYYNHKAHLTDKERESSAVKTIGGRKVYGGDGITPDEIVPSRELNATQRALLDPIFFYSREISAGRIPEFRTYQATTPVKYGQRIRPGDFILDNRILQLFYAFLKDENFKGISPRQVESELNFIKSRITFNLAVARFGNVAANQVLVEEDPQIEKAVEVLPRAQQLALSAEKGRKRN